MTFQIETLEDGRVVIPFTRNSGVYNYTDALILEAQEYEALSEDQINEMMDLRFTNWYSYIISSSAASAETPVENNNG